MNLNQLDSAAYSLPVPQPDEVTAEFWRSLGQHRLVIQRCADCATLRHPPSLGCSSCGSERSDWVPVSGHGSIYSFSTVSHPVIPAFRHAVPYTIVQVALDEIPSDYIRMHFSETANLVYGNLYLVDHEIPKIGSRVKAFFEDVSDEVTLLQWRLLS